MSSSTSFTESTTLKATWEEVYINVKEVSLNKSNLTIARGKTSTVTATISPSNATSKKLTWTSSNPSVATVSDGVIKAIAKGTTVIGVTTNNGKTDTVNVTVNVPVESISITKTAGSVSISKQGAFKSVEFTATVKPSDADTTTVTWAAPSASGSTASASSDIDGNKITITARDNWGSLYRVSVKATIGEVSSNELEVLVEPNLSVYKTSGDSSNYYTSGAQISYSSNYAVAWTLNSSSNITVTNKNAQAKTITAILTNKIKSYPNNVELIAKTASGQEVTTTITVAPSI